LKSLKFEAKALGLDAPWVSVLLAVMPSAISSVINLLLLVVCAE
jgi:hypothetical protein